VGVDDEREMGALRPDRYYLLGDAGSFFFDPAGDNDGFESPAAAAEWARTQTIWPDLAQDLRDGIAAVVLGAEMEREPGCAGGSVGALPRLWERERVLLKTRTGDV
jgi:hypothetical protein